LKYEITSFLTVAVQISSQRTLLAVEVHL